MNPIVEACDGTQALSIRRHVRSDLPFLRRFGRALTGNGQLADLCLLQLMDDIAERPAIIGAAANPRVTLYSRLMRMLEDVSAESGGDWPGVVASSAPRRAQLLMAVEGFSRLETAEILGVGEPAVVEMLTVLAASNIMSCNARVLVIEDEPLISLQLEVLLGELGHSVLGVATTRKQAAKFARRGQPDLVLSDVQLADGSSGIEAVGDILDLWQVPVIYITAFPERLLRGRRNEPNFIVSKPFDPDAIKAIVGQALFLHIQNRPKADIPGLANACGSDSFVDASSFLKTGTDHF